MTKPLLCVTVTASTMAELRRQRDAVTDADLVELRLDGVSDPSVAGALSDRRRPVVLTCRPSWEGGAFRGSEDERRRLLDDALSAGAEWVDVEWKARFDDLLAKTGGRRIVLSYHRFEGVPPDLAETAAAMRGSGAEVVKIAVGAQRLSDNLPLLELGRSFGADQRAVLIAMGDKGLVTRILASRFRSCWTYAGAIRRVGQLTPADMLDAFHFRSIGAATDLYGVVGSPVAHSVSPAMHNASFRAIETDAVYLPLPSADADDFVTFARGIGLKGASVTLPFKVPMGERVDEMDPVARRVGAINTIRITGGKWSGANTDVAGFLRPLQDKGIRLRGTRASILGAGGSARAVAIALGARSAEVTVHARSLKSAADVAQIVDGRCGAWPPPAGSWDLLVNCTPVGMHPRAEQSPVPASTLTGTVVYDLVYNPTVTRLLRDASTAGCQTIGGLDMLVAQADEQFHWWTGMHSPAGVMRAAALKQLAEFATDEDHVA